MAERVTDAPMVRDLPAPAVAPFLPLHPRGEHFPPHRWPTCRASAAAPGIAADKLQSGPCRRAVKCPESASYSAGPTVSRGAAGRSAR